MEFLIHLSGSDKLCAAYFISFVYYSVEGFVVLNRLDN